MSSCCLYKRNRWHLQTKARETHQWAINRGLEWTCFSFHFFSPPSTVWFRFLQPFRSHCEIDCFSDDKSECNDKHNCSIQPSREDRNLPTISPFSFAKWVTKVLNEIIEIAHSGCLWLSFCSFLTPKKQAKRSVGYKLPKKIIFVVIRNMFIT